MRRLWRCVLCFSMFSSFGFGVWAAPLALPRVQGQIVLDGKSDEPAWQRITPLPLTMFQPVQGSQPSERSEIRIAYDDHFLYASAQFYDSDPASISANSLYRDRWNGDDTFELILDTFNDNENALKFVTTPNGIRHDEAIFNDATGSDPFNINWNTVWDVAVQKTDQGWFAEIRIPFSSLRFQPQNGKIVMGLSAYRYIARKNETDIFPARDRHFERAVFRPSLAQDVSMEGIQSKKPFYVSPYVLAGLDQSTSINPADRGYRLDGGATDEFGGDAKLSLSSDLTLDLTGNTDFAQVESDELQVNLNRFSLFFPEKRPFFQERASLFDFPTGRSGTLFYSRRIGLDDEGNPVRIFAGGRLSGRLAGWDLGMLDMQTGESDVNPSENFGVLRMRRPVLNDASFAGGIFTSRMGIDGSHSLSYGLDSKLRLTKSDWLTLEAAQTVDEEESVRPGIFSSGMARMLLERPTQTGWGYRAGYTFSGPDFNPAIGFLERRDFSLLESRIAYGKEGNKDSIFQHQNFSLSQYAYLRNEDESVESSLNWLAWEVNFKRGQYLYIAPQVSYESVRKPFALSSSAYVPAGNYQSFGIDSDFNTPWGRKLGLEVSGFYGGYFGGRRLGMRFWPRWYVSKFLELSGDFWFSHADFPDRNQSFDFKVLRFRTNIALNTRYSISSLLQYSSSDHSAGVNVRFRYNPSEGNDIYVVYNQGFDTDRIDMLPRPPQTTARSFLIKYVHMFNFAS